MSRWVDFATGANVSRRVDLVARADNSRWVDYATRAEARAKKSKRVDLDARADKSRQVNALNRSTWLPVDTSR